MTLNIGQKTFVKNYITMLGRKQSLKGEPVLADYGPEESLNESADIEWVNKVKFFKNLAPLKDVCNIF